MKKHSNKFVVQSSPFNPVKFELGVILAVAVLVWILLHSITDDFMSQFICLVIYSITASCWLVIRIRYFSNKIRSNDVVDS